MSLTKSAAVGLAVAVLGAGLAASSATPAAAADAGAVAAGVIGGAALGAVIAGAAGGPYYAPPPRPVYRVAPAYVDEDYVEVVPRCRIVRERVYDSWGDFAGFRPVRVCR